MKIDKKQLKANSITTSRCHRGCLIAHVVNVEFIGGEVAPALITPLGGDNYEVEQDMSVPLYVACRHITGRTEWSDVPLGNVTLTQEDVRTRDAGTGVNQQGLQRAKDFFGKN